MTEKDTDITVIRTVKVAAKDLKHDDIVFFDLRWREIIEVGEACYDYKETVGMPKVLDDHRYIPIIASHDRRLWGRIKKEVGRTWTEWPAPDHGFPVRAYLLCAYDLFDVQVRRPMSRHDAFEWGDPWQEPPARSSPKTIQE